MLRHPVLARTLVMIGMLLNVSVVQAQTRIEGWTPPVKLFETTGRASEAEIVADPSGAVHAFWAYSAPDSGEAGWGQAIYYAVKQDAKWSEPVDILVSPGNRVARMPNIAVDNAGVLHVVWSGGSAIFYSRAYGPEAGSATSWTYPQAFAEGVTALEPSIIAAGTALYVVWIQPLAGVLFVQSQDGGVSWSQPLVAFEADQDNELARLPRLAMDGAGRLHLAVTQEVTDLARVSGRSNPNYLYYLRSEDQGATWSEPFLVTPEPDFGEITVATFGNDTVHLVWNGRAGRHGRYHRMSSDGGKTWNRTVEIVAPDQPGGDAGLTGIPALVTDATGALHMITTSNRGNNYLKWLGGSWSRPVLISPGLDGKGVTGTNSSLEQPAIALSVGNELHVVFHDGFQRIWYTTSLIDAPYQAPATPQVAPTPQATPASAGLVATAGPTVRTASTETQTPPLALANQVATSTSALSPLLIGVLPAALLIGVSVIVIGRRQRPHSGSRR